MRMLAFDPGSTVFAWAYFNDQDLVATGKSKPPAKMTWLERMERISDDLAAAKVGQPALMPEVLVIEETIPARARISTVFYETRGYLIRVISHELFPNIQLVEVPLPTIRRSLGLRANEKREIRQAAARERWPGRSQDEADACAVALGAWRLMEERAV